MNLPDTRPPARMACAGRGRQPDLFMNREVGLALQRVGVHREPRGLVRELERVRHRLGSRDLGTCDGRIALGFGHRARGHVAGDLGPASGNHEREHRDNEQQHPVRVHGVPSTRVAGVKSARWSVFIWPLARWSASSAARATTRPASVQGYAYPPPGRRRLGTTTRRASAKYTENTIGSVGIGRPPRAGACAVAATIRPRDARTWLTRARPGGSSGLGDLRGSTRTSGGTRIVRSSVQVSSTGAASTRRNTLACVSAGAHSVPSRFWYGTEPRSISAWNASSSVRRTAESAGRPANWRSFTPRSRTSATESDPVEAGEALVGAGPACVTPANAMAHSASHTARPRTASLMSPPGEGGRDRPGPNGRASYRPEGARSPPGGGRARGRAPAGPRSRSPCRCPGAARRWSPPSAPPPT